MCRTSVSVNYEFLVIVLTLQLSYVAGQVIPVEEFETIFLRIWHRKTYRGKVKALVVAIPLLINEMELIFCMLISSY